MQPQGSGAAGGDPYTPFLRVTNSFNGARALRFHFGFMRKHCSNGVIFEQEVATVTASHRAEALKKLKLDVKIRDLAKMWDEFTSFVTSIRAIQMTAAQSMVALNAVLRLPQTDSMADGVRKVGLEALKADFAVRLDQYRRGLGENAYAVFNTLTDIAARSPQSQFFQKDRHTVETAAGRWLRDLARGSVAPGFKLNAWIAAWDHAPVRRVIPGRN